MNHGHSLNLKSYTTTLKLKLSNKQQKCQLLISHGDISVKIIELHQYQRQHSDSLVTQTQTRATLPDDEHHESQNFHNLPTLHFLHHLAHKTSQQCHLQTIHPLHSVTVDY